MLGTDSFSVYIVNRWSSNAVIPAIINLLMIYDYGELSVARIGICNNKEQKSILPTHADSHNLGVDAGISL
jgi:hypothetical protein